MDFGEKYQILLRSETQIQTQMVDWKRIEIITGPDAEAHIMKKYTQEEREMAIKEIEAMPIKSEEWVGPHETKITSFRYVDDVPHGKKKGFFSELIGKIKSILHPA